MTYIGPQARADTIIRQGTGTGNGAAVAFAMGFSAGSDEIVFVTLDGVLQHTSAYNISGSTCTFTAAPPDGVLIEFRTLQSLGYIVEPSDGSVNANKMQNGRLAPDYIKLEDQKATTVSGGNAAATTWNIRDLNTEVSDTAGICTLVSNQFTLPAGTYRIKATAPSYSTAGNRLRLRNITDTSNEILGPSAQTRSATPTSATAHLVGEFTITAAKTFELQHYTETAQSTNGLGTAVGDGDTEIYSVVEIWKVK